VNLVKQAREEFHVAIPAPVQLSLMAAVEA
jgi:hypothetical protein